MKAESLYFFVKKTLFSKITNGGNLFAAANQRVTAVDNSNGIAKCRL